ncbi:hypothetical protein JTE90_002070 [Oedothorax gibbosus]|uniref:Uncharacterized protein n=1 Tax=Oedothorax gibbosus TaxID=931172 RepID=A0AAV6UGY3_9ARAC|nr:hypothetical protein JTE90_002070 [Oedothorax gibbosus]
MEATSMLVDFMEAKSMLVDCMEAALPLERTFMEASMVEMYMELTRSTEELLILEYSFQAVAKCQLDF